MQGCISNEKGQDAVPWCLLYFLNHHWLLAEMEASFSLEQKARPLFGRQHLLFPQLSIQHTPPFLSLMKFLPTHCGYTAILVRGTWGTPYANGERGMADILIVQTSSVHASAPCPSGLHPGETSPAQKRMGAQPHPCDSPVGLQVNPCCLSAEQSMDQ